MVDDALVLVVVIVPDTRPPDLTYVQIIQSSLHRPALLRELTDMVKIGSSHAENVIHTRIRLGAHAKIR